MSLHSRRTVLLMLPLAVAACGFTQLYAPGETGAALRGNVLVDAPEDREGYVLVRELEHRLGRGNGNETFALGVMLKISSDPLAVTATGETTRVGLVATADYVLRRADDDTVILKGKVSDFTGYSYTGSTVETLAAERDARARLMTLLAERITTQLYSTPDLTAS